MKPGIMTVLWTVTLALAATACSDSPGDEKPNFDTAPAPAESIKEIPGDAFAEPGAPLAEGWNVPQGTKLMGSLFPSPDTEDGDDFHSLYAEAVVTVDPHDVLRDLLWQTEKLDLTAIQGVWEDPEYKLCEEFSDGSLHCGFEAADKDGRSRMQASIEVSGRAEPYDYSILEMELFTEWKSQDADRKALKAKVKKPKGKASVQPPEPDTSQLKPGELIPTRLGTLGVLAASGEVPKGSYLLSTPYPYSSLGISAMFVITGDVKKVGDELKQMAVDECGTKDGEEHTQEHDGTKFTYWQSKEPEKEAEPFGVLETWNTADDLRFAYLQLFCGGPA